MLLAVDIGNTDVVLGVWHENHWKHVWRIRSLPHENTLYYESRLRQHLLDAGLRSGDFGRTVVSSVVPPLTGMFRTMLGSLFGTEPLLVSPEAYPALQVRIDRPHELGTDLFANAVAAYAKYRRNCVVVDFGTALTFTTVSAAGEVLGVAIAPGLRTAVKALAGNTAQLPDVPLRLPASAIGKNTVQSMQAGILWGYVGLVESLLGRIRAELGGDCVAVATGGLSSVLEPLQNQFVETNIHLTLDGLRIIGENG